MGEMDDIPLKLPGMTDGGDGSAEEMSEAKPGENGLALAKAIASRNGAAIEEMIKKIVDSD